MPDTAPLASLKSQFHHGTHVSLKVVASVHLLQHKALLACLAVHGMPSSGRISIHCSHTATSMLLVGPCLLSC